MPKVDTPQIDELLETLTGVLRARVRYSEEDDRLSEIHVMSDGAVAPKQIVRNIETALRTAFDIAIDHRVVSIAVLKEGVDAEDLGAVASGNGIGGPSGAPSRPRVVFRRLRVVQDEPLKCAAHVELELDDVIFEGTHRDTDTPRARVHAAARAVIEALEYLAEKEMAFYLAGLESLSVFQKQVVVVMIEARERRERCRMLGTAVVEGDPEGAAVRAVLDAVNRFITRPRPDRGARA